MIALFFARVLVPCMIGASILATSIVTARADEAQARSPATIAAAEAPPNAAAPNNPASVDPDAWRFRATAYAWLINTSGNATARGQTTDFNANFVQLIQKSDSLIGWMSYFEADKGKVGVYADFVWTKLGFSNSTASYRNPIGGLQLSSVANQALTFSMTIVEVGGVYEVVRWPGSGSSFTAVDALLGFRYWNNSVDMTFDRSGTVDFSRLGFEVSRSFAIGHSGNIDWIDPIIGFRVRHQFTPNQELLVRGDIGGFGLGSQFAWQAVAGYSYAWQFDGYALAGLIGYRALSTSYTAGYGTDTRGIDVLLHGPIIGVSLRF